MFSFEDIFHLGEEKQVARGEMGSLGRVGHGGHAVFGQKMLNTQHSVAGALVHQPFMKWANALKEPSKKIH